MDRILSEVNYDLSKIKLVKCIGAHNEEDWIEFVLRNNYDEFDIIRIVEGAVEGRPNSTHDGHSTDRTVDIIRNFPDPANKIELYQMKRHFKSLEEQKQIFLDVASPDEWLFIVDADEFYMEGEINRVRRAIHKRPSATEIIPTFLHFYRDFFHLKAPHPEWQPQHQRIIRYQRGMKYLTHPVATLPNGQCSYFTPEIQPLRHTIPNLYIFHYGHAKGKQFHQMKAEFYRKELAKYEGRGGSAAAEFDIKLDEFVNFKEDLSTILHYNGPHPNVFANEIRRYVHENFYDTQERAAAIKNWKSDKIYSKDKLPTIAVWMEGYWGTQRMNPFYNEIVV